MGRVSIRQLRALGVSDEDIQTGLALQERQRQSGATVLSLAQICGIAAPPNRNKPVDFTVQAQRRRGSYDQAALLLDQSALSETSHERAELARQASRIAKDLSASAQIEFDFFRGGNMSIGHQYHDAVSERLRSAAPSTAKRNEALAILWTICRHMIWESYECTKTAADLCDMLDADPAHMSRALDLLESVGAIKRVKVRRTKVITVTPEGVFRGNINKHAQAVEKYRFGVIDGGLPAA